MAFVGQNEILILDREMEKVYRILDNKLIPKPILDVNVATIGYRGMLGIDTSHTKENVTIFSSITLKRLKKTEMTKLTD